MERVGASDVPSGTQRPCAEYVKLPIRNRMGIYWVQMTRFGSGRIQKLGWLSTANQWAEISTYCCPCSLVTRKSEDVKLLRMTGSVSIARYKGDPGGGG